MTPLWLDIPHHGSASGLTIARALVHEPRILVALHLGGQLIDAPADALALAVRTGAPIFAADEVVNESGIEFEHEDEDAEEVVDKFKEFLDQVTPEDFKGEE